MSRNGSGTFSLPYPDFVAGTTISSDQMDANNADIVAALTDSIAKDGQTTPTADLPMGGFKHTNVDDAAARNNYAAAGQVQDGAFQYGTVGGTGDAITLTLSPAIAAYAAGQRFIIKASAANTGATTLAVSGLTAKDVHYAGAALVAGAIRSGAIVEVVYDGTQFQMVTPPYQVTAPGQPAFSAYNSNAQANVTGDDTTYTILFNTEIFDRGGDFTPATGIFAAPVTGIYNFSAVIVLEGISGHTNCTFELVTSNRSYYGYAGDLTENTGGIFAFSTSWIADMDAADTAKLQITVTGGSKVIDIANNTTVFSGYLVA